MARKKPKNPESRTLGSFIPTPKDNPWSKKIEGAQNRMVQQIDPTGNKIQLIRTGIPSVPIIYAVKRNVALTVLAPGIYCLMVKDPYIQDVKDVPVQGTAHFEARCVFSKLAPSIDIYGTFSTEILESAPEGFPSEDEPKKSNIIKMP